MVQGLGFLSKKSWHTKNIANQEKVWMAEQQKLAEEKKMKELAKQIRHEKEQEEFDRIAGGKKTVRDRGIDWMYQEGTRGELAQQDEEKRREEFLLGKEFVGEGAVQGDFDDGKPQEGIHNVLGNVVAANTDADNSVASAVVEDAKPKAATKSINDRMHYMEPSVKERNEHFRMRVEDPMFHVAQAQRQIDEQAEQKKRLYERVLGPVESQDDSHSDSDTRRNSKKRKKRSRKEKKHRKKDHKRHKTSSRKRSHRRSRHRDHDDASDNASHHSYPRRDRKRHRRLQSRSRSRSPTPSPSSVPDTNLRESSRHSNREHDPVRYRHQHRSRRSSASPPPISERPSNDLRRQDRRSERTDQRSHRWKSHAHENSQEGQSSPSHSFVRERSPYRDQHSHSLPNGAYRKNPHCSRSNRSRDYEHHDSQRPVHDDGRHRNRENDHPPGNDAFWRSQDHGRDRRDRPHRERASQDAEMCKYGLKGSSGQRDLDLANLGPDRSLLTQRRGERESERNRLRSLTSSRRRMTAEERKRALEEMERDGRTQRTRLPSRERDCADMNESRPKSRDASFLHDMSRAAHGIDSEKVSLQSRVSQNRNNLQRSHESFL